MPDAAEELSRRKRYFERQSIESAKRMLRQLQHSEKAPTLRTAVADLFEVIQQKRAQHVPWATIHEALNRQFTIDLRTLTLYFAQEQQARQRQRRASAKKAQPSGRVRG